MRNLKMTSVALLLFLSFVLRAFGDASTASTVDSADTNISEYKNNLAAAVAAIGAARQATLTVATAVALSGNVTIPANIAVVVVNGGSVDTGRYALTINGSFAAGLFQVFAGAGPVTFGSGAVPEVFPEWWGARGDGASDDTAAINKAIAAFPTVRLSDKKTYILGSVTASRSYLDNTMLNAASGMTLKGAGYNTVLKRKDHMMDQANNQLNAHMVGGSNLFNVTIQDIRFEENGANNLTPAGKTRNGMALKIQGGGNVKVRNAWFSNGAGTNSVAFGGTGKDLILENNHWSVGGRGVAGNHHNTDFSFVYSEWSNSKFLNNTIEQSPNNNYFSGGIEIHGSDAVARGNTIRYCEPGIWIASTPNSIENISVSGNLILNSHRGIAFWRGASLKRVMIDHNVVTTKTIPRYTSGASSAISIPTPTSGVWGGKHANGGVLEDIIIANNDLSDTNGRLSENNSSGIWLTSIKGVKIVNNYLTNFNSLAIALAGSPYGIRDLDIEGNTIRNWGSSSHIYGKAAFYIDLNGSSKTPAAAQYFASNITFKNNKMIQDALLAPPTQVYFFTWPKGAMSNLIIKDNFVNANAGTLFAGNQGYSYNFANGVMYKNFAESEGIAAPTTGTCQRGDRVYNTFQVAPGAYAGWICVESGSPGVWKGFGLIAP